MSTPPTERYFFVHMQKTGGTTLVHRLPRRFHPVEIYPNESDGDVVEATISVGHLLERWRIRGQWIRCVAGHFPLCTTEILGVDFTTLVILRDPVERTLSYLRHHREMTPADRSKPLEAIYEDPVRFPGLIHNHMVKMLSLTTEEMTNGVMTKVDFDGERLGRAKAKIDEIDVVGFQERYAEFWREVSLRYGWPLGEPDRSNQTVPVKVAGDFRARIAEDNALDAELYDYAMVVRAHAVRRSYRSPVP